MFLYCQVVLCLTHIKVKTKHFFKSFMSTHCFDINIGSTPNDYRNFIFILLSFIIFHIAASVAMISDNTDNLFFLFFFLNRGTVFYCKLKTGFRILSICYIVKKF